MQNQTMLPPSPNTKNGVSLESLALIIVVALGHVSALALRIIQDRATTQASRTRELNFHSMLCSCLVLMVAGICVGICAATVGSSSNLCHVLLALGGFAGHAELHVWEYLMREENAGSPVGSARPSAPPPSYTPDGDKVSAVV